MSGPVCLIAASGVSVQLGGRAVLSDVSFTADQGELVALLGPNGAGKTTLFRALLGLVPLASGSIVVEGVEIGAMTGREMRLLRRRIGFVPQRLGLVPSLSALGNVLLGRLGYGTLRALPLTASSSSRRAAMAALERVDMAQHAGRPVAELSGGQQQRVAIARMLVQEPAVILADEPVASLDPQAASTILGVLRGLADEGHSVVVTLHQLEHVDGAVDRVVGLRDGSVFLTSGPAMLDAGRFEGLYGTPV